MKAIVNDVVWLEKRGMGYLRETAEPVERRRDGKLKEKTEYGRAVMRGSSGGI